MEEVQRNAYVLCLDVPAGTEFGIDYKVWQVGQQFKGIKGIPPGVHFVYYSSKNLAHQSDSAPRTGFFLVLQPGEVSVWRWNPQLEDFYEYNEISEEEKERFVEGVRRFDFETNMGPYPTELHKEWLKLSSWITPEIVHKLEPLGKKISSLYQPNDEYKGEKKSESTLPRQQPYFTEIPKARKMKAASPQEITQLHMDKSPLLKKLLDKEYPQSTLARLVSHTHTLDPNGLLGELQFAFICFLMGQSYDAFEQWKDLVALLCSCDKALYEMPDFFSKFVGVIHFQMQQVPEDFFVDIVSGTNFLTVTLKSFFELVEGEGINSELREKSKRLQGWLEKTFGVKFGLNLTELLQGDMVDEDAPVIVQL